MRRPRAVLPLIIDDAVLGFVQPLAQAPDQFSCGERGAADAIEELGWAHDLDVDIRRGPGCRASTRPALEHAHLAEELPGAHRAEHNGFAADFPKDFHFAAKEAQDLVRRITFAEEKLPPLESPGHHGG